MRNEPGLLIRRGGPGATWSSPEATDYEAEDHLQEVLAAAPEWLPAVSAAALTVRELQTGAGPADICVVDADGSITVVECKLASSSDGRRKIIGQVIDYAAAIWHSSESQFLTSWANAGGPDLAEALHGSAFESLRSNLATGHFSMCLAVDSIDADLRRVIEYLNQVTLANVNVTAVQLSYARDGDVEILIPTTYGAELAEAKTTGASRKERWTRESFIDSLVDEMDRQTARWLLDQTEQYPSLGRHGPLWFGVRPGGGVFLNPGGRDFGPAQLGVNSAGALVMYGHWTQFSRVKGHPGFARLAELLGQDHRGPSSAVRVASVDRQTLWDTLIATSEAVNAETTM